MRRCAAVLMGILLMSAAEAAAQSRSLPAPDFMLGRPKGTVGLRGGWTFARAGSDWYDFVTRTLTLENKDFNRPAIGTDLGVTVTNRLDVLLSLDFSQSATPSEYRDFVDNLRLPIEQSTTLRQTNLAGGVKFYLLDRGREVSRFAWVPRSLVPYVGGGAGAMWFNMEQTGDFVDFVDSSIFADTFRSSGIAPTGHIFGGVDLRVWRRLYVTIDARHLWASGDLGRDWIDFDPIDLTGTRVSAGVNVIF